MRPQHGRSAPQTLRVVPRVGDLRVGTDPRAGARVAAGDRDLHGVAVVVSLRSPRGQQGDPNYCRARRGRRWRGASWHCGVVALPAVSSRCPCHGDTPGRGPQVGTSAAWGPAVTFRGDPHAARREARRGAAPRAAPALPAPRTCTQRGGVPWGATAPRGGPRGGRRAGCPGRGQAPPAPPAEATRARSARGCRGPSRVPKCPGWGWGGGSGQAAPPLLSPNPSCPAAWPAAPSTPPSAPPAPLGAGRAGFAPPPATGARWGPQEEPPHTRARGGSLRKPRSQPPHPPTPCFDLCRSWWKKKKINNKTTPNYSGNKPSGVGEGGDTMPACSPPPASPHNGGGCGGGTTARRGPPARTHPARGHAAP